MDRAKPMSNPDDPREKFRRPLERPSLGLPSRPRRPLSGEVLRGDAPASPPPASPDEPAGGLARLLVAVAKMLQPKPAPEATPQVAAPPPSEPPVISVLVAAMNGDTPDGLASHALFKLLESKTALKIKPLPRAFPLEAPDDPDAMAGSLINTRHAVVDEDADLLLWGDIAKEGYRLRLSGATPPDGERPATFGASVRIDLPTKIDQPQLTLLYAAILAAFEPANELQRAALRRLLPQAALGLEALAAKLPPSLSPAQQRTIVLVHGHVCTTCALVVPPSQAADWFQKGINAYRASEKRLTRTDPSWEGGLLHRHLAAALMARAERVKDKAEESLTEAVQEWRAASDTLTRANMPQEWVTIQIRLGFCLYRLDLLTGNTELLREALQVLQTAAQVVTRTEAPQRWAEIMHTIARVLEVYGDQLRSPEVLARAIEACKLVLEVQTRERVPLGWAAVRNTLGSALFLIGKHGGTAEHLEEAIGVLEEAREIFTAHGAKGLTQVADRNLAHVRKLIDERKGRQVIDPDWVGRRP